MANPTALELENQLRLAVRISDNLMAVQTVPADLDAYDQVLESDYAAEQAAGARAFRDLLAAAFDVVAGLLEPILRAYVHHIVNRPDEGVAANLDRIYEFFVDNAKTIQSRAFTYGAVTAAGGNNGNGALRRYVRDHRNFDIEHGHAEIKRARCIGAQSTGRRKHNELFQLLGQSSPIDSLAFGPSSTDVQLEAKSSEQSLLANSSFSDFQIAGTVSPSTPYMLVAGDSITGWTISVLTVVQLRQATADQYRLLESDPTPTAVRLSGLCRFSQRFSVNGISLARFQPIDLIVPAFRDAAGAGTLVIGVGTTSKSFNIAVDIGLTYTPLFLDLTNNGLWPDGFDAEDPEVFFEITVYGAGTVTFDEVSLLLFDQIDGTWWCLHAGAEATPFLLDDEFTQTDSIPADSKIQKWIATRFNKTLPHAAVPTIAD
jgi:hypothetical protein